MFHPVLGLLAEYKLTQRLKGGVVTLGGRYIRGGGAIAYLTHPAHPCHTVLVPAVPHLIGTAPDTVPQLHPCP